VEAIHIRHKIVISLTYGRLRVNNIQLFVIADTTERKKISEMIFPGNKSRNENTGCYSPTSDVESSPLRKTENLQN